MMFHASVAMSRDVGQLEASGSSFGDPVPVPQGKASACRQPPAIAAGRRLTRPPRSLTHVHRSPGRRRTTAMATRDILKTLQTEHDELRALFEEMEATTDRAEKKRARLLE